MEIVLVDDGSTDGSPALCDRYAARYPQIRVVHQKNGGLGVARTNGVRKASGDYVTFTDSDDWVDDTMVSAMVRAALEHEADILVSDWKTFRDEDTSTVEVHTQNIDNSLPFEKIRAAFLEDRYPNFLCNKLFRRSLFDGLEMPPTVLQDLYVSAELFARSRKIWYIPEAFYWYRTHASFASTRKKTSRKYGMFLAWREHERVCEKYGFKESLPYSRFRAQQAAVSLLVLDKSQPYLSAGQEKDVRDYLEESRTRKSEKLKLKHKALWYMLDHMPFLCGIFGDISIAADRFKQYRKHR